MIEAILFVILASVAVAGALAVVLARNPVYSAMGLLATMFALAVFYVVHLAHFVAAVQVIVYAGAVITLFLFVIMLIGVDRAEDTTESLPGQRKLVIALVAVTGVVAAALTFAAPFDWVAPEIGGEAPNGTIEAVSTVLFSEWLVPVIGTALLLTIGAVGALSLAYFRPRREP
ncbi:MAG: NADH-quinone oxidoreductase subunit J [Acidimicrobiia bacterium]